MSGVDTAIDRAPVQPVSAPRCGFCKRCKHFETGLVVKRTFVDWNIQGGRTLILPPRIEPDRVSMARFRQ